MLRRDSSGNALTRQPMTCAEDYARVLVVNGSAFGHHSPTAITLTNLFAGWPAECLALVHLDDGTSNPGAGICSRIWQLSSADVPIDGTVRRLLRHHTVDVFGRGPAGMPSGLTINGNHGRISWRNRLHAVASAWADMLPLRPPPEFWSWVDEFRPQVIYSMLASARIMGIVLQLAKKFRIPIVPHLMDDWPATHYRGWSKSIPRAVLLSRLRSVLRGSQVGMSIGADMAVEFTRRYRLPFQAFMNCVAVDSDCPTDRANIAHHPLRFVYIGGLHLWRWQALQDIGQALLALHNEHLSAELVVHAPVGDTARFKEALAAIPTIRLGPTLAQDQVVQALGEADVLVHVESFDPAMLKFTRLSVSTKIPQYMASGKAILAYGPRELASCRYVEDSQCGIAVGMQDQGSLLKAIRTLASDPKRRAELGRRGWEVARENHECGKVRNRFRRMLAGAVGQPENPGLESERDHAVAASAI